MADCAVRPAGDVVKEIRGFPLCGSLVVCVRLADQNAVDSQGRRVS